MTRYELLLATFVSAIMALAKCDQDEATARIAGLMAINQEILGVSVVRDDIDSPSNELKND